MKKIKKRSLCPVSSALDIIGDKWSLLIVRDIIFEGKRTYNEFLKSEEGIATNILADRLLMLEEVGILRKEKLPDSDKKYGYRLTKKGADLIPMMMEMVLWSDKYLPISDQAKALAEQLRKDKQGVIGYLTGQLKK